MKIAVLTGAGISAESGIKTFRDADGLWEGHDVIEVATPEGWAKNQTLVQKFYNERRRQLLTVSPNAAHTAIAHLEETHDVVVITQNVDDLHERAGSSRIIHLHGELRKVRSTKNSNLIYDWDKDVTSKDTCQEGSPLRPHIVWFGEAVPALEPAINEIRSCEVIIIIGTSMQVYPAASLTSYAGLDVHIYYVDPNPQINFELRLASDRLTIIKGKASEEVPRLVKMLNLKS